MPSNDDRRARLLAYRTEAPHAARAHPRPEHFMPAVVAAGAARLDDDGTAEAYGRVDIGRLVHSAWVRGCFSLASYMFESKDESFKGLFGSRPNTTEAVTGSSMWS